MPPQPLSRRSALAAGLGGAAALGLAACSTSTTSAGGANSATAGSATAAGTTAGSSSAALSSAASSGQAASTHSTGASGGGAPTIAALSAVKVGDPIITKVDGKPTAVARPDAKTVVAHSAICTHQGCTVQANGKKLVCPCHGSQFDAFTGAVLNGPAAQPLASVAVKVSGTNIVAG